MSDFKGVIVYGVTNSGSRGEIGRHESASTVFIVENHLHVRDVAEKVIAIYAPGKWTNADVKN